MAKEEKALEIRTDRHTTVAQANKIIRANQEALSVMEAKFLRLIISQTKKSDDDLFLYKVSCGELAEILNIPLDTVYHEAKNTVVELMKKVIVLEDKSKHKTIALHWVETMKYDKGVFTIRLSNDLKPYLLQLQELFTVCNLNEIMALPTTNSIRLYELIESYREKTNRFREQKYTMFNIPFELALNEIAFSIEELRKYFNCENKYSNTPMFIKRVIEPSVIAINNNCPLPWLKIKYRAIKREDEHGKYKTTHIVFDLGKMEN